MKPSTIIILTETLSGSWWARYVQDKSCLSRAACLVHPFNHSSKYCYIDSKGLVQVLNWGLEGFKSAKRSIKALLAFAGQAQASCFKSGKSPHLPYYRPRMWLLRRLHRSVHTWGCLTTRGIEGWKRTEPTDECCKDVKWVEYKLDSSMILSNRKHSTMSLGNISRSRGRRVISLNRASNAQQLLGLAPSVRSKKFTIAGI